VSDVYLVYVDDSGDESFRLYSAIFVRVDRWRDLLRAWLNWRRQLEADYGIPVAY
jgi:hypothetical protein